jgi:hypothetical protein
MDQMDLSAFDLEALSEALEDNSPGATWWVDPGTGEVGFLTDEDRLASDDDPNRLSRDELENRGVLWVEPMGSRAGYADMEDFIALVPDRRAADLLTRAIAGRGAFRRFKDTLYEFPDLRPHWFTFKDARMERRAVAWLADHRLVPPEQVEPVLLRQDPVLEFPPVENPGLDYRDLESMAARADGADVAALVDEVRRLRARLEALEAPTGDLAG